MEIKTSLLKEYELNKELRDALKPEELKFAKRTNNLYNSMIKWKNYKFFEGYFPWMIWKSLKK